MFKMASWWKFQKHFVKINHFCHSEFCEDSIWMDKDLIQNFCFILLTFWTMVTWLNLNSFGDTLHNIQISSPLEFHEYPNSSNIPTTWRFRQILSKNNSNLFLLLNCFNQWFYVRHLLAMGSCKNPRNIVFVVVFLWFWAKSTFDLRQGYCR